MEIISQPPLITDLLATKSLTVKASYHIDINSTKPGLTVASITPRRKRLTAIPAKDLHAGVVMMITPYRTDPSAPYAPSCTLKPQSNHIPRPPS